MRRALELAATAAGQTFPNPAVGSLLVKNGIVVGEGYHPKVNEMSIMHVPLVDSRRAARVLPFSPSLPSLNAALLASSFLS